MPDADDVDNNNNNDKAKTNTKNEKKKTHKKYRAIPANYLGLHCKKIRNDSRGPLSNSFTILMAFDENEDPLTTTQIS